MVRQVALPSVSTTKGGVWFALGGEADHVHLLAAIHPALNIFVLVNNLKSASPGRMRARFAQHLRVFYCKPSFYSFYSFWHLAHYVGRVGGACLETVKPYVESQGTTQRPRKRPPHQPPA